jgi:hypothetical protein
MHKARAFGQFAALGYLAAALTSISITPIAKVTTAASSPRGGLCA